MSPLTRKLRPGELVALDALVATLPLLAHLLFDVEGSALWHELPFTAAIVLRRLWPLATTALLVAGAAVVWGASPYGEPLAVVLVLYTAGLLTSGWRVAAGLVAGVLASVLLTLPEVETSRLVPLILMAVAAWTTGRAVRVRRQYVAREAARRTEQALAEERLRIARDLHDVVAHGMSLITVQSAVAALAVHQHPDAAADALRSIETTSRASITEMRRMLGVLRSDEHADAEAERAPAPGLRDLPELARRARQAGVEVTMNTNSTDTEKLPDGMALSIYRIVQEALTNVVKHAAPARCHIDVAIQQGAVTIEVTDDGPGTRLLPEQHAGHGLVGMRERVAMYGGHFTAGPRAEGGFMVSTSWEVT